MLVSDIFPHAQIMELQVLLHLIGIVATLLPFSKILADLVVLLEQSRALSIQLIGLAFNNDRDFLYLCIVELDPVSSIQQFSFKKTKIPFKDLQGVLNDQLHVISNLFTGICLSLRTLSYSKVMLWYSIEICLARSSWLMISYSYDTSAILYLVFGFGGDPGDTMTRS